MYRIIVSDIVNFDTGDYLWEYWTKNEAIFETNNLSVANNELNDLLSNHYGIGHIKVVQVIPTTVQSTIEDKL